LDGTRRNRTLAITSVTDVVVQPPVSDFAFWRALFQQSFFAAHILEFAGLEDLAAFFALDEFTVFVSADDLHTRVLAGLPGNYALRGRGRLGGHRSGKVPQEKAAGRILPEFPVF
jgi:hypothetical protein